MSFLVSHTARLAITAGLCFLSIILFFVFRQKERLFCMLAMVVITTANIFFKDPASVYSSIFSLPFICTMISNILLGLGFYLGCKDKKEEFINIHFKVGVFLTIICIAVIASLSVIFSANLLLLLKIIPFFICLGFNVSGQLSFASNRGGLQNMLIGAALMMLLASFLKFIPNHDFLYISENISDIIYPLSYLLVILFNSDLKNEKSKR